MMSKKSPQLRFEGFTDDWVQRKLGDLVDSYNKIVSGKSNYPVATSSRRGLFLQSDYFDGSRSGIDENVDFHKVPEKYITYRHMSDDSIFKFNQNDFDTPVLVSKEYPVFRSNQQANQTFLLDHLNNSPEFLKFSTLQKLGGTRVRLYFKNLQAYKLMMPNIEEQNAIASFFTTVDNLIAANQRKLDLLKEQKKGYLQKMFPKNGEKVPELRFAGFADDWEERKLSDLFIKGGSGGTPKSTNKAFYDGDIPFLGISDITKSNGFINNTEKHISSDGLNSSAAWIVSKGAISLAMYASVGKLAILNIDAATSQAFYNMIFDDYDLRDLVYQRLNKANELSEWNKLISTGTQSNLNADKVKNFQMYLPKNHDEIKLISTFFKQIDNTIALHQRKLDLLKEQKKGLLQKMFV